MSIAEVNKMLMTYNRVMQDSIFTKIIKGEVPCQKIYEDDQVIAFLDMMPINPGHTLIVPKQQVDHLWDVDDPLYHHVMDVSKLVALRIREVLQPVRVGMQLEGFGVPHAHVHVFPLHQGMQVTYTEFFKRVDNGLKPSNEELDAMAKKLMF
jgi:histidine triad (HIT) family protein